MIEEQHHGGRRGRLFEAGRMKLLVLHLIQQAPKHGYEIIKDIADLVGGDYSPSAGTIYPTLNWLEDMNYVTAENTAGDRKQYHMTELGAEHLQQQQQAIQELLAKLQTRREIHNNDALIEIHRAMENLKTALRLRIKGKNLETDDIQKIATAIDQAAIEITRL